MVARSALLLLALLAAASCVACYNVDPKQLSVSGLSAGGFMAVQLHVAYSATFKGAAVFAGGPYYCAQKSSLTANGACMKSPTQINVNTLLTYTNNQVKAGTIDNTSNLNGQSVYIFSGSADSVVVPGVVQHLVTYYQKVATGINIKSDFNVKAQHCIPTLNFGSACATLSSPYVSKCNYDGAGIALNQIYGQLQPAAANYITSNLYTLTNQTAFTPKGKSTSGLAPNFYVYVPTACQNGATCKLHVSLHGCSQNYQAVQTAYYLNAGFNTWAESNNIIVVYPQAIPVAGNPYGCFDWWGYSGAADYALKSGPQMMTVMNIVNYLSNPITKL